MCVMGEGAGRCGGERDCHITGAVRQVWYADKTPLLPVC